MRRLLVSLALTAALLAASAFAPAPVGAACHSVPVSENTPTGIAGCATFGTGIGSHYGPGSGVAMNFCTWSLRHSEGCGLVRVTALRTGASVVVPVVDFCDCFVGTSDERIVDMQWGVLRALGLPRSRGLYRVQVQRAAVPVLLPNTSVTP